MRRAACGHWLAAGAIEASAVPFTWKASTRIAARALHVPPVLAQALVVALLVLLGAFTAFRNFDYRSAIALWEDATRKAVHKARAHNNLGDAYGRAGDKDRARASFLKALGLDPDHPLARNNLRALDADLFASPRSPG
jgi:Flp pilus assembly protein TadD